MSRVARKQAVSLAEAIQEYLKASRLTSGLNTQRIFAAWDACSGAAPFTLKRFYRGGKLYITLSSSVIRNQLYFQKDELVKKMNAFLSKDELFTQDDRTVSFIEELILR